MSLIIRLLFFAISIVCVQHVSAYRGHQVSVFDSHFLGCDQTKLRVIQRFKTPHNTHIAILEDKQDGKKFIVKQDTRDVLFRHLAVARDKLGAFVAQSIGIPANRVEIIPAHYSFPGKKSMDFPATLHTFVPGTLVKMLPKELKTSIYIQQAMGLTEPVITSMAEYEGLCRIVALDTFIANGDRHRGNFFYDQESDCFFVIDLESSFAKDLAVHTCSFIRTMLDDELKQIEPKRLAALKKYRSTLKQLIKRYTPDSLYNKLIEFSAEGGLFARSALSEVRHRLDAHREAIEKNYNSCKKLVVLLDRLFKKYDQKN